MHLCTNCQSIDWGKRIDDDLKLSKRGGGVRTNCPYCTHVGGARVRLPHISHVMCDVCAKERSECQACGASTLSTPEQARMAAFEGLFDAYVTLVKTYGATTARKLLLERRNGAADFPREQRFSKAEDEHVDAIVAIALDLVDSSQPHQKYHYRLKRPIWTKVWGSVGFDARPPRCEGCLSPGRSAPAMTRAEKCGHWTAGAQAAWCLPCAVERRLCSCCETSTE